MDWKTFTVSIINSLIWPISLFVFFLIFKTPVKALLSRIAILNYKDFSLKFDNEIEQIEKLASKKELETAKKGELPTKHLGKTKQLFANTPKETVFQAWDHFENIIIEKAKMLNIHIPERSGTRSLKLMNSLSNLTTLQWGSNEMFRSLQDLRNRLAHLPDFDISWNQATEYANNLNVLVKRIEEAERRSE